MRSALTCKVGTLGPSPAHPQTHNHFLTSRRHPLAARPSSSLYHFCALSHLCNSIKSSRSALRHTHTTATDRRHLHEHHTSLRFRCTSGRLQSAESPSAASCSTRIRATPRRSSVLQEPGLGRGGVLRDHQATRRREPSDEHASPVSGAHAENERYWMRTSHVRPPYTMACYWFAERDCFRHGYSVDTAAPHSQGVVPVPPCRLPLDIDLIL